MRAAIVGIAGMAPDAAELATFARTPPAGVILFARNVQDPVQLAGLVAALRAVLPAEAVLMIDQEGGRVARLRPPHWRAHPPAGTIGALHARDAAAGLRGAFLTGALIGAECRDAGIDVAAAPVLDLALPGRSDVVGDRGFAADPAAVAALGRAMANGLLAAGVVPVAKHAPGHGRAHADSHHHLPAIAGPGLADDVAPFAANADLPWMMTAHVMLADLDPDLPATLSPRIVHDVIRGRIGFGGVLVSDDLAMGALLFAGTPAERARAALAAGCDLALFCTGEPGATADVLRSVPDVGAAAADRLARASALARMRRRPLDPISMAMERDGLLA